MNTTEKRASATALEKLMGLGLSVFQRGFSSSKCKTEAKLAIARIKLLRNKREVQVRQMRRDIAMLLESGREDTARIRIEHVIREQNVLAANEIIELFCELVVARLSIIGKQRDCPADLKEGISSLIFAAPRCSELPELCRIHRIFEKKYGKDFASAATDLRPNCGVNRMLIEKLSVRKPTGETKLKIMKEIAKEYQVKWDTTESELELLKPPDEVLEGPRSFVCATSMPVKSTSSMHDVHTQDFRPCSGKESSVMEFQDTASAAQAAAVCAKKAASAAQAAVYLAQQNSLGFDRTSLNHPLNDLNGTSKAGILRGQSLDISHQSIQENPSINESKMPGGFSSSHNLNCQSYENDEDMYPSNPQTKKIDGRRSYTAPRMSSDIQFDDSDGFDSEDDDDEDGRGHPSTGNPPPPNRPPPVVPPHRYHLDAKANADEDSPAGNLNYATRVHPKLPDYEILAARFEALKSRKS